MKKSFIYLLLFITFQLSYAQIQKSDSFIQGVITIDSSQEIKQLVSQKIQYNSTNVNSFDSYRIQLFYGSENGALRTQSKFRELFPNTATSLEYDSPNWKIKVGHYKTRLIADKHLQEIILSFGDAIVIEPKK